MKQQSLSTVGVRFTGWAALGRDPQDDRVEFRCPHCAAAGSKPAKRPRSEYRFVDGFLQDEQGETINCRECRKHVLVAPVVLVHNEEEKRRFEAVFLLEPAASPAAS